MANNPQIKRGERIQAKIAIDYVMAPPATGKGTLKIAGLAIPSLYSSAMFSFYGGAESDIFKESHYVRDSILVIPRNLGYLGKEGIWLTKVPLVFDNIIDAAREHNKTIPQEYFPSKEQVDLALRNAFDLTGRDERPILTITPTVDELAKFAYEQASNLYLPLAKKVGTREIKIDLSDLASKLNSQGAPFARAVKMHGSDRGFKISADGKNLNCETKLKGFRFVR